MMGRCYKPNHASYERYGARGITVCERWHAFAAFLEDVGYPPFKGASIERPDNSKGYGPDNFRWATRSQQMRNTQRNVLVTWQGKTKCATAWDEKMGFPKGTVNKRLKMGWTVEEALLTPIMGTVSNWHDSPRAQSNRSRGPGRWSYQDDIEPL